MGFWSGLIATDDRGTLNRCGLAGLSVHHRVLICLPDSGRRLHTDFRVYFARAHALETTPLPLQTIEMPRMFAQVMRLLSSPAWIAKGWASLDLARQFLLGASVVVLTAMTIIGWWVSQKIERSVTENTAHAAALFMESSVAPLIQGLASAEQLQ